MIEEVEKTLSVKKNKWLIPAVVGGVILGLYALTRSGGGEATVISDGYASPAMSGEVSSNSIMLENLIGYVENLESELALNKEQLSGIEEGYKNSDEQQKNVIDNVSNSISNITDKLSEVEDRNPKPILSNGVSTPAYGWGYEPTKTEIEANNKRLASDPSYKQSEIDRAKQVISNRTSAGMDITSQLKYLDSLIAPNKNVSSSSKSSGVTTVKVNSDGKAPKGLTAGSVVKTGGGDYKITGVRSDGSYISTKI